jgi:hypothetical protein
MDPRSNRCTCNCSAKVLGRTIWHGLRRGGSLEAFSGDIGMRIALLMAGIAAIPASLQHPSLRLRDARAGNGEDSDAQSCFPGASALIKVSGRARLIQCITQGPTLISHFIAGPLTPIAILPAVWVCDARTHVVHTGVQLESASSRSARSSWIDRGSDEAEHHSTSAYVSQWMSSAAKILAVRET